MSEIICLVLKKMKKKLNIEITTKEVLDVLKFKKK